MPYVVTKNAIADRRTTAFASKSHVAVGGDLKYRVAPNITLDATVNPDFGQVESDPAVLNLSAYESFFDERRPFFVAGRGLFRFDVNCSAVNCNGEGLYYSRRIGRTPELAGIYGDTRAASSRRRSSARRSCSAGFRTGSTFGVLDAMTQARVEPGRHDVRAARRTSPSSARRRICASGNSSVGAMLTAVNRSMDQLDVAVPGVRRVRRRARFPPPFLQQRLRGLRLARPEPRRAEVKAAMLVAADRTPCTTTSGPTPTCRSTRNRTVLSGDAEEFKFGKVGGQHLMFETAYQRRSPGFEINDLGFLRRADQQSWNTWVGFFDRHERAVLQALPVEQQLVAVLDDRRAAARGGVQHERAHHVQEQHGRCTWAARSASSARRTTTARRAAGRRFGRTRTSRRGCSINGDDRQCDRAVLQRQLLPQRATAASHSTGTSGPELDFKMMGRFSSSLSLNCSHNIRDNQWYGNYHRRRRRRTTPSRTSIRRRRRRRRG